MSLTRNAASKLAVAAENLQAEGDERAGRIAAWIAFTVSRAGRKVIDTETQVRLARTAGAAADEGGLSISVLASRVIDPVLAGAGTGELLVDVGELEELNAMRQRLNRQLMRFPLPLP